MNLDTNKLSSAVRMALTLGAVAAAGVAGTAMAQATGATPSTSKNAKCWRWLKTDHLCWFKTDQGWRPRGTPLGCG